MCACAHGNANAVASATPSSLFRPEMSSVKVAVRARPFSQRELASGSQYCLEERGKSITLYHTTSTHKGDGHRSHAKQFNFDHSYWSVSQEDSNYVSQEQVYSELGLPVIAAAFTGYNSCIFAYGQTGSGKTYTMTGYGSEPGLTPRICQGLFERIEREVAGKSGVSYRTEFSYMEIYNERVRDLLCEGGGRQSLRVREHPKDGPYVEGLTRYEVERYSTIDALLTVGNARRATASTKMNDTSSRSHAIFTLTVTQAVLECGLPSQTRSKLHLVDLAGSERVSATGAEGARLKEGRSINRSLVCLGSVISALADKAAHHGTKPSHIPYRDSVLTYLLKDSLGGNAKTVMIATVSPADSSYGETLSTLRYASRARAIINKPVVNEDPSVKVIRELRSEIGRLKTIITTQHLSVDDLVPAGKRAKSTVSLVEDIHKKEERVAELTREWASKWKSIQQIVEVNYIVNSDAREVALHSEGAKMVVHSDQPHLVGIDPDILSTGLVFFYLKGDTTTVGSVTADPPADIVVSGTDIADQHCKLAVQRGKVLLQPLEGDCYINRCRITDPGRLRQGDLLQLGDSAVFRFNHPQEAKRLRKRHSEGLLDPRRLARQHRKRTRTQSSPSKQPSTSPSKQPSTSPSKQPSTSPSRPPPTVTAVQLQSTAVVRATGASPPVTSLKEVQSRRSFLSLPLEQSEVAESSGLSSLASIVMSPLSLFMALASKTANHVPSQNNPTLIENNIEAGAVQRHPSRWRRLLYVLLLLFNAPLLLAVVGTLTLPAIGMLALLLSSVKVCGVFQRFRLSRWLATPLALVTTLAVAPVAHLFGMVVAAGFYSLTALHLIQPSPLHTTRKPA